MWLRNFRESENSNKIFIIVLIEDSILNADPEFNLSNKITKKDSNQL
ncbi:hypothetical protein LEP1GSC098_0357 [Leptospira interrogans serovar Grippotyphosa str. UI 08434]|nr:hypothetical protein LEP1GSC098_0357 [Leptospira interrogans serovar Grippotyphosa str. UI 08434]